MAPTESALRAAARSLAADLVAAEVVSALRVEGVRTIVLKGPAVARLLYPAELRGYGDVDLLVEPGGVAAEAVLARLCFAPVASEDDLAGHRPPHAREWRREAGGASVDLHVTLSGAGADPASVWEVLCGATEGLVLGGVEVEILEPPALALETALHAAHHGPRATKPAEDLRRALGRLPRGTWEGAAALAARLDATAAFAAGLRLSAAGAALARSLGLPDERPVAVALRAAGAPPLALGLDWLARTPGLRAKARLVARTALPPSGALRVWRPLARRRRLGLVAAYATHPFWLAWHALPSLAALRRARRGAR